MRGPGLSGLEAVKQFQYLVLGVCGQRVPAAVHGDAGASRELVVEPHVGGARVVELDVPVAERRYLPFGLVAQRDLRESRAVGRRRPHRKQFRPCARQQTPDYKHPRLPSSSCMGRYETLLPSGVPPVYVCCYLFEIIDPGPRDKTQINYRV